MDQDPETQGNNPPESDTPASTDVNTPVSLDSTPVNAESIPDNHDVPLQPGPMRAPALQDPSVIDPAVESTSPAPATGDANATVSAASIKTPSASTIVQPPKNKHHHKKPKSSKHHNNNPPVVYARRPILLIVLMILLIIVLVGGAGLATWYFVYYNNPNKVAYDAINNFLHEPDFTTSGIITTRYNHTSIMITFDSDSANLANSSKVTLTLSPLDANGSVIYAQPYQVEIGDVIMADGALYLRVDDLMDAIDRYLEDHSQTLDDLDITTLFGYQIAEALDGEWWQISIPDIIDFYSASPYDAQPAKELYTCMVNVANRNIKQELADLYNGHQFINIARVDKPSAYGEDVANGFNSIYQVNLDYGLMADFINAMPDSETANNIYNCINRYSDTTSSVWHPSAADFNEISSEQLQEALSSIENIELEITNFGHQLVGININGASDTLVGLHFQYHPVTIAPPNRYHSFLDLIDEIAESLSDSFAELYGIIYDPDTHEWQMIEDDFPLINEVETT